MKTAKQTNNSTETMINLFIAEALDSLFELSISKVGNVGRGIWANIHKFLKRSITSLFKLDVVVKCVCN